MWVEKLPRFCETHCGQERKSASIFINVSNSLITRQTFLDHKKRLVVVFSYNSSLFTGIYLIYWKYTPPACAEIISSIFSCKIGVKAGCVTSSSPRLHKMGTIHHLSRDAPQEKPMFTCIFIGPKQSNALAHFFHLTFYSKQYVSIKIRSGV